MAAAVASFLVVPARGQQFEVVPWPEGSRSGFSTVQFSEGPAGCAADTVTEVSAYREFRAPPGMFFQVFAVADMPGVPISTPGRECRIGDVRKEPRMVTVGSEKVQLMVATRYLVHARAECPDPITVLLDSRRGRQDTIKVSCSVLGTLQAK